MLMTFAEEMRCRWPGLVIWPGTATGRWWAMHPALPHLVDGATPREIAERLRYRLEAAGVSEHPL
ncbi:hypothetical protein ACFOVU_15990 [Nocardiopsis sediminis]|uniref:Uncharacterized protein n=1 Tax=Nocardiopsis sediminis TaxID=1778267 RepID=A0ABV8FQ46_9ACTN